MEAGIDMVNAERLVDRSSVDRRYARLHDAPLIGASGVAMLGTSKVAILGLGNIGGQLAQHFVLLGTHVVLVDRDVVGEVNFGTQSFAKQHIGMTKADARAQWLGPLNPACRIEPIHADIRHLALGRLRDVDLILCCLDHSAIRVAVNEIAFRIGVPWIDGALDGSGAKFFGRVAAYDPRDERCGCYLCPHSSTTVAKIARESEPVTGCSAAWTDADRVPTAPTLAVSALGAAVASIQAVWGLGVLLKRDQTVIGREVYFDLDACRMTSHRLRRNPHCIFDHHRYPFHALGLPADRATVAHAFDVAERLLGTPVTLELQRRALIGTVRCASCGAVRHPFRAGTALERTDLTCACGAAMRPVTADLLERFRREDAARFLHRTWFELGIPQADVVVAVKDEKQVHLLLDRE